MTGDEALIDAARRARELAYAPFSRFRVGAAVRARSGRIYAGCNIENASYGLTLCAERVAVFKAVSEGEREFEAVAVFTAAETLTPPCGACRQILWELCGDIEVLLANAGGSRERHRMSVLLPLPFSEHSL